MVKNRFNIILEIEDERGVLLISPEGWDGYTDKVINHLSKYYDLEAAYFTKWLAHPLFRYEGTVHLSNGDLLYTQIEHNNKFYYLSKSKKGKFVEGHEIRNHPLVKKYLMKDL